MDGVEALGGKGGGGPIEVGGGDELLGGNGEGVEEGVASARVEFAEDIVEEEDGWVVVEGVEETGLGEFEGEGEGTLLTFGGEGGGGVVVEGDGEVIAVGADQGEAAARFFGGAGSEGIGEVGGGAWRVLEGEGLGGGAADVAVSGGGPGGEGADEFRAETGEGGAMFKEQTGKGGDLAGVGAILLEESIAGAEGFVIGEPGGAIGGKRLGPKEIEVPSATFAGSADEGEVVVPHPDKDGGVGEVAGRREVGQAGGAQVPPAVVPEEFEGNGGGGRRSVVGGRRTGISGDEVTGEAEAVGLVELGEVGEG